MVLLFNLVLCLSKHAINSLKKSITLLNLYWQNATLAFTWSHVCVCLIESGAVLALISAEMPNWSVCRGLRVAGGNTHWYHSVAELPVIKPVVAVLWPWALQEALWRSSGFMCRALRRAGFLWMKGVMTRPPAHCFCSHFLFILKDPISQILVLWYRSRSWSSVWS